MTKIVDLRGDSRIMGPTNPNRSVAGITKIARHHSATASGMYLHSKTDGVIKDGVLVGITKSS